MTEAILGISCFYHDSAAALVADGDILAAAQEERFSRKKHDAVFPLNAVRYVLKETGYDINDLAAIIYYDKPLLKFERFLETAHAFAPKGLSMFLSGVPVWIKEKLFLRQLLHKELTKIGAKKIKLLFSEHHYSHAASAFYPSPFSEAAILTLDGVGEWATTTIGHGKGNKIDILKELYFPHSLGLLYSAFTYYCGFRVNSGEYKLMGLAPYGNPDASQTKRFKKIILNEIIDVKDDGSFILNMKCFDFATGLRMCNENIWDKLFDIPRREQDTDISRSYANMALAVQQITEDIILRLAMTAKQITGSKNLTMAGGVALNCVANGKLLKEGVFEKIWVQPAAGDAGGALGAALLAGYINKGWERRLNVEMDAMSGAYLGPEFNSKEILCLARKYNAPYKHYDNYDLLAEDAAKLIAGENVVGWFQGRMEWGPRALGNRSIIADPRSHTMQKKLNIKIKHRENFRPFAPSVLAEEANKYFDIAIQSPYMLFVAPLKKEKCKVLPEGYEDMDIYEKLYCPRSELPAITHVDGSARIHTVNKTDNERYWKLIKAFQQRTGCPVLLNTSFNVRGEPMVCSPEDAYKCFMQTEMDYLVIENYLFSRKEQLKWSDGVERKTEYELD